MIKIDKTDVYGFESAIRGMRNPLNSHHLSDSYKHEDIYIVGDADLKLMKKLTNAGASHGKFMRYIHVSMDVAAPLYFWKEFDTYKVATVANSTSTMHKIMAKEFTEDMFSFEHMYLIDYKALTLSSLNFLRERYLETKDKKDWYCLIQALPSSFNQTRTIDLNYEVLKKMYHDRKGHKLYEWHEFCAWIESLPFAKELILGE